MTLPQSAAHSQLLTRPLWMFPLPWFPMTLSLNTTATWCPRTVVKFTATQARCMRWLSRAPLSCRCWVMEVMAEMRLKFTNQKPLHFQRLFQSHVYPKAPPGQLPASLSPKVRLISVWTATSTVCCSGRPSPSGPADPGPASVQSPQRAS